MASERKKGRKGQGGASDSGSARPSMKQRTLFDSFSKNTPKSTTPPQAPTVEIVDVTADSQADGVPPTAETTSKSAATTNIPTSEPSKTDATPPQIIALVDIPDPHLEDIQEVVEIQDHPPVLASSDDVIIVEGTTDAQPTKRRSPSILILEEHEIRSSQPTSSSGPTTRAAARNLSRQTSSRSDSRAKVDGKSKDKPIIIASSPIMAPASIVQPNKPIHPFFAPKAKKKQNAAAAVPPSVSGPVSNLLGVAAGATTPFAFGNPNFRRESRTPGPGPMNQLPPYPDQLSLHVRGPQTIVERSSCIFPLRTLGTSPPLPPKTLEESRGYDFLKNCYSSNQNYGPTHPPSDSTGSKILPSDSSQPITISPDLQSAHPAIARLASHRPDDTPLSCRPWSEKWRPSCAAEVLGNEKSAVYLRDWLRALELQMEENVPAVEEPIEQGEKKGKGSAKGKKANLTVANVNVNGNARGTKRQRPMVVRAVDKTRRKKSRMDSDEEDNWIVYTDDEDEDNVPDEIDYRDLDDLLMDSHPNPPLTSSPSSSIPELPRDMTPDTDEPPESQDPYPSVYSQIRPEDLGQLHNTILLTGPSGSGKTASVYACAEELGWDVFEVYPGIGRRNGANVDNLVGEVGKNHLVVQQNRDVMKSFLGRKGKGKVVEDDDGFGSSLVSSYSPRKKAAGGQTEDVEEMPSAARKVRQSLILLEEVDILFKEDTNFWSTVTRIIKECKRPVICTCNDLSLVPTQDLPLQSILYFAPCPSEAASSYLQALCAAEGFAADRESLVKLYTEPLWHAPRLSAAARWEWVPDLRGTINALQVTCSSTLRDARSADIKQTPDGDVEDRRTSLIKRSDFLSYLNCYLGDDISRELVADELAGHVSSEDDETGHVILHDVHASDTSPVSLYDRQQEMVSAAVEVARGLFDVDVVGDAQEMWKQEEERQRIQRAQTTVAQEVCPRACDADGSVWYVPIVRQIIAAEDEQEVREMGRAGGRATRNSRRYVRMVDVSVLSRECALLSGYGSVSVA